jgi:hypothetical protein
MLHLLQSRWGYVAAGLRRATARLAFWRNQGEGAEA